MRKNTNNKKEELFGIDCETSRGFPRVEFQDAYENPCSIQISSLIPVPDDDGVMKNPLGWIWLGINDANPQIMKRKAISLGIAPPAGEDITGWMPYPVPGDVSMTTRMHLNEHQVRGLIDRLTIWLETGNISPTE